MAKIKLKSLNFFCNFVAVQKITINIQALELVRTEIIADTN